MGNTWKGISEVKFKEYEKKMLLHSGVPIQDIEVFNVLIDNQRNYIRTVRVKSNQNPVMILIHGYGGSSIVFWKIIKPLQDKYNLFLVDVLGMGGSS
ncbi:UNKNOWN [Stylonychia lemnae]|uniref:AB hydrolase-1 domain-containing protein n=1 Tax=Stylonychia lemnae TaxID=5949 RepID=A0A078BDQ5_STYLE|nr:UNKNOWN [Stylonychia lemnae]|eukprot:CDW91713.1 UNKNOWN [Stylonychia lemnae]